MTAPETIVFVVDDDLAVRDGLAVLLRTAGHEAVCYESAQSFLDGYAPGPPGCLIVDLRMPGITGLELQQRLIDDGIRIPLIVLTGYGDVPAAVRALKGGAVDFMEKPFDPPALLEQVDRAVQRDRDEREAHARTAKAVARFEALTPREREVVDHVAAGAANKVVAIDLGISERTVELHRSRAMKKLDVRSVVELVRIYRSNRPDA